MDHDQIFVSDKGSSNLERHLNKSFHKNNDQDLRKLKSNKKGPNDGLQLNNKDIENLNIHDVNLTDKDLSSNNNSRVPVKKQ